MILSKKQYVLLSLVMCFERLDVFPPETHFHCLANSSVSGLPTFQFWCMVFQFKLMQVEISRKADSQHGHPLTQIAGLQDELAKKAPLHHGHYIQHGSQTTTLQK